MRRMLFMMGPLFLTALFAMTSLAQAPAEERPFSGDEIGAAQQRLGRLRSEALAAEERLRQAEQDANEAGAVLQQARERNAAAARALQIARHASAQASRSYEHESMVFERLRKGETAAARTRAAAGKP